MNKPLHAEGGAAFYRYLALEHLHLDQVEDAERAVRVALRLLREAFCAKEAALLVRAAGAAELNCLVSLPQRMSWNEAWVLAFLRGARPKLPQDLVLIEVHRRHRQWGAFWLQRDEVFSSDEIRDARRIGRAISKAIERVDLRRIADVRERVDRKLLEQIQPKDLFYQILHGLRTLTHYDHSAAILTGALEATTLEVVAEQVAWHKGKSECIGKHVALDTELRQLIEGGAIAGFDRVNGEWQEWSGRELAALAKAVDYNSQGAPPTEVEETVLCAAFATRGGELGLVKIAAKHRGTLGTFEAELVRRFLPHAAVAMHNMQRTASIERGLLEAEKRAFLANLARGVSHDVNNAVGNVLPLVQQMALDLKDGRVEPAVLVDDLRQIETSLQVCRRIFGGMLAFARSSAREAGTGDVRKAIESTLSVLEESFRRERIGVTCEIGTALPLIQGLQSDLEQLFLNLATNARDAMQAGGALRVQARAEDGVLRILIQDSGHGLSSAELQRIQEPFYTTKPHGNGIGLSICRSIVWKMRGTLTIESAEGQGTQVWVVLPLTSESHEQAQL